MVIHTGVGAVLQGCVVAIQWLKLRASRRGVWACDTHRRLTRKPGIESVFDPVKPGEYISAEFVQGLSSSGHRHSRRGPMKELQGQPRLQGSYLL
ncbi:hypothetical protein GCM10023190_22280 [Enteractinococcus fodinae]